MTMNDSTAAPKNWKNVNNWHWVEKNCLPWAREYLTREMVKLSTAAGDATLKIASVRSIDGDVDVNVRKGKVIYLFDLKCVLVWCAVDADGTELATGDMILTDCSFDEEPSTYATEVTLEGDESPEKLALKSAVQSQLRPILNAVFTQFPIDLVQEQGPALLVSASGQGPAPAVVAAKPAVTATQPTAATASPKQAPTSTDVKTVKVTVRSVFKASAQDVFDSLLDEGRVTIWTGDRNCVIKKEPGTKFSLMNHSITGELTELDVNRRIVMQWRLKAWPAGHLSTVTIKLSQGTDSTTLDLVQTGVPFAEEDVVRQNWENIYFNRVKHIFGYAM